MAETPPQIQKLLHRYWGPEFVLRGAQPGVVAAIAEGRDVLALLPTGEGKSLCFQLGGLLHKGIKLVVSPLIALMQDQVRQMQQKKLPVIHLQGGLKSHERQQLLQQAVRTSAFIYLSPEQLQSQSLQQFLQKHPPAIVIVDEAHCMSQWGHDFRPAYRQIMQSLKTLFTHSRPVVAAFTATAPVLVADDIEAVLELNMPYVVRGIPIQPFIHLKVQKIWTPVGKYRALKQQLQNKTLIYANTRSGCEDLAQRLQKDLGEPVAVFHAGQSVEKRGRTLQQFSEPLQQGQKQWLVATKAFGMGIDIGDIQRVIHWQRPESLSAYVQEVGRAGRDRKTVASGVLLALQGETSRLQSTPKADARLLAKHIGKHASWSLPAFQHKYQWNINTLNAFLLPLILSGDIVIQQGRVKCLTDLTSAAALEQLWRAHEQLTGLRKRQLQEIKAYVSAKACRRLFLYEAFGNALPTENCGQCDRCV